MSSPAVVFAVVGLGVLMVAKPGTASNQMAMIDFAFGDPIDVASAMVGRNEKAYS
jgi:hypothetical protein